MPDILRLSAAAAQARRRQIPVVLFFVLCLGALLPGCSFGYTAMKPGENSALYAGLFSDVISGSEEPRWLWVRGVISGEFKGDGGEAEEAVIATVQSGDPSRPGPIEIALLAICDIAPDGTRTAVARTVLFDRDPIAGAPAPENDLHPAVPTPLTRVRAQVVQDKATLKETVVVYFWGDVMPGSAWYAGYIVDNNMTLQRNMETAVWQKIPGFLTANLDRSLEAVPFGYQLILGATAIPPEVLAKLGEGEEEPIWGHVYARNLEGRYERADERFGVHYRRLENQWNRLYLKAVFEGLPPEDLAWFEYFLGIINRYTGKEDMALRFLRKARAGAKSPQLVQATEKALGSDR